MLLLILLQPVKRLSLAHVCLYFGIYYSDNDEMRYSICLVCKQIDTVSSLISFGIVALCEYFYIWRSLSLSLSLSHIHFSLALCHVVFVGRVVRILSFFLLLLLSLLPPSLLLLILPLSAVTYWKMLRFTLIYSLRAARST